MQIAEAAIPLYGIPYRKRRVRRTTPHTRLAEPRRDRLATRGMYTLLPETQEACCCLRHRGTSGRRDDLWNSGRDGNDVVAEELTAYWIVAELVMHQRLRK